MADQQEHQEPEPEAEERPAGPVVRVPTRFDGTVEAPAEAAAHWDDRIWRQ